MMAAIGAFDAKIFHIINGSWSNPLFDFLMPLVSELGSSEILFIISLAIFALRRKADGGRLAVLLFAGLTVTFYIVYFLKSASLRPRPHLVFPQANILEAARGSSFPSGHTAQAFMAATVFSSAFRRMRIPFFAAAAMVGYSRIYLGAHFLTDVVCGAVIGLCAGYALVQAAGPKETAS